LVTWMVAQSGRELCPRINAATRSQARVIVTIERGFTMKIREFIKQSISVDVVDDVCEELYIAFDGPVDLTAVGEKRFREVLDYEIELHSPCEDDIIGIVHIDDEDDVVWERRLRKAKDFFESLAGYCTDKQYRTWFK